MTKKEIVEDLEKYLVREKIYNNGAEYSLVIVSAMNLLSDLKGYKVQYCRKSGRSGVGPGNP